MTDRAYDDETIVKRMKLLRLHFQDKAEWRQLITDALLRTRSAPGGTWVVYSPSYGRPEMTPGEEKFSEDEKDEPAQQLMPRTPAMPTPCRHQGAAHSAQETAIVFGSRSAREYRRPKLHEDDHTSCTRRFAGRSITTTARRFLTDHPGIYMKVPAVLSPSSTPCAVRSATVLTCFSAYLADGNGAEGYVSGSGAC